MDKILPSFWPFTEAHFIVESAQRTNSLVVQLLGSYDRINVDAHGRVGVVPVTKYFAEKKAGLSGLEVADFIIHTGGAAAREDARVPGKGRARQDYVAVFGAGGELVSFMEISSIVSSGAV
jgi:hypothetical protein